MRRLFFFCQHSNQDIKYKTSMTQGLFILSLFTYLNYQNKISSCFMDFLCLDLEETFVFALHIFMQVLILWFIVLEFNSQALNGILSSDVRTTSFSL